MNRAQRRRAQLRCPTEAWDDDLAAELERLNPSPARREPVSMIEPNAIRIKIGTLAAEWRPLLKRRPKGGWAPALRRAPNVGEMFYVARSFGWTLLRCTEIKPDLGPLYYAERV